jgi:chitodextrinase
MKRIAFFASFVGTLFLLAGVSYFFISHATKASAVITNVRAENIIGSTVQIKWTTNLPSDSRVAYGFSTASSTLFSNSRCDAGGYITEHCVILSGLSVSTVYYYKVESASADGSDSQLGGFQFISGEGSSSDTVAPSVPTGLIATVISSSEINLSWTPSTDTVAVEGYKVYRGSAQIGTSTANSYSDTSLPEGTSYTYTVSAFDTAGNQSEHSLGATGTTTSLNDTAAPTVPTGVTAAAVSSSQINLAWTASTDNKGVAGYKIYKNGTLLTTVTTLSYNDPIAAPGTSYEYKIAAFDAAGNISAASAITTATTPSSTAPANTTSGDTTSPVITNVKAENITGSAVQIKWVTDDLSDSLVSFGAISGAYTETAASRCDTRGDVTIHCISLAGLSPETKYYYKAVSKNPSGLEAKSSEYSFMSGKASSTAATAATTTANIPPKTTLAPVTFAVKIETPSCEGEHTVAGVSFSILPNAGGYLSVKNVSTSLTQTLATGSVFFQSGTYEWKGIPKSGYAVSGTASGTLTILPLAICSKTTKTNTVNSGNTPAIKTIPVAPSVSPTLASASPEPQITQTSAPESYQESENLMRQKYQEAESIFRKENKIPVGRGIIEEEKRKIVDDIHSQISVLAPAAESILLGTTTLFRLTEPERVVKEVSRILTLRANATTSADIDKDGISDYDETYIYGTNPNKMDTDGDGISDDDEILAGIDPIKKIITPVPYEDPKEVVLATKIDSKIFSVQKIEAIALPQDASTTKPVQNRIALEGTGLPNSFVTIYIFSTPIIVTIKTDSDGKWKYTTDKELPDGNHEVYVAMTESAGKIIAKSNPIPFVKTAQAVTLQSNFALADTSSSESPAGFFNGGVLPLSLVILFIILGLSFMVISFVSKKSESDDHHV